MNQIKYTKKWWLSPFNTILKMNEVALPKHVTIYDVTLREGEQMAGVTFNREDKILIARKLDEVGVEIIEVGNPVISKEEREDIRAVAKERLNAKVTVLCRTTKSDIDLALKCDAWGVALYPPAGLIKIKRSWKSEVPSTDVLEYAKRHGLHVAFYIFDALRLKIDFVRNLITNALEHGNIDSIILCDSSGCATPQAVFYQVKEMRQISSVPIGIHCHNDFGLATANTLSGVCAGASVVHVAVNALGERCGNAAFEEVVMGLKLLYGIDLKLNFKKLHELSKLVEKCSGVKVSINKPFVGDNAFRFEDEHVLESVAKHPLKLLPILPEVVGQKVTVLIGKNTGPTGVRIKLREMGMSATEKEINDILQLVKQRSHTEKRSLSDEEFTAIVKKCKQQEFLMQSKTETDGRSVSS